MKQLLLMFVLLLSGITNAQTFNFSCLIAERLEELNEIADNSLYTHVNGVYHTPENYGFRVIRTAYDGSEIDYFGDDGVGYGISNYYLGLQDASGSAGWDKYLADAKLAVADSEKDGLRDYSSNRKSILEGAGSSTTSVTIEWINGATGFEITVGETVILAGDYGHKNFGKSTTDQFDALLKAVEDAVLAADGLANLSLGDSRKQQLEDLSRDGVFVNVTNDKSSGYFITFLDSEDNHLTDGDGDPFSTGGGTALEDLTDFDTSLYVNIKNKVTYIIDNFLATSNGFTIEEETLMDNAVNAASTPSVNVTWSEGTFTGSHTLAGDLFAEVLFTDLTGKIAYNLPNKFLNGQKPLEDRLEGELEAWIESWTGIKAQYQKPIRDAFITKLEAAFIDSETDTVDISLTDPDENGDVILFSNSDGSITEMFRFNEILEDLTDTTIDNIGPTLDFYVSLVQADIDLTPEGIRAAYISEIDDLINTYTAGTDVFITYDHSVIYGTPVLYQGTGDVLVLLDVNGDMTPGNIKVYATIPFGGNLLEDLEDYEFEAYLASFESEVARVDAAIKADN